MCEILHFFKAKNPTTFQRIDVPVSSGRKRYSQPTHTKKNLGQVHMFVTIFVNGNTAATTFTLKSSFTYLGSACIFIFVLIVFFMYLLSEYKFCNSGPYKEFLHFTSTQLNSVISSRKLLRLKKNWFSFVFHVTRFMLALITGLTE